MIPDRAGTGFFKRLNRNVTNFVPRITRIVRITRIRITSSTLKLFHGMPYKSIAISLWSELHDFNVFYHHAFPCLALHSSHKLSILSIAFLLFLY